MKKFILILLLIGLTSGVFGQIIPEYNWLIDTWFDPWYGTGEWSFSEYGSGNRGERLFMYSINQTYYGIILTLFYVNDQRDMRDPETAVFYRINDNRIILDFNMDYLSPIPVKDFRVIHLVKRN